MNRRLACGGSPLALAIAALMISSVAYAEAAGPPAAAPSGSSEATVGEIVVTAEKREASLETTTVAVTAFTAEKRDLLGIQSVQDLTDYTPGLSYSTFDNRPYIRGIGRQSDNLAVESGVAVYEDGIYFGANASTILQLDTLFIDRIDVLRGPQSTLYGRNADGGAINYVSHHPAHEMQEEIRTGYDNYQKYFVEGVVSGPITDHLRFLVGGNYTDQKGGYYTNLTGPPEGGGVAQGGNGFSYHGEVQLEGDFGDKFDWWLKAATNDYDVSYHTESQQGALDTREFYDPLFPNQNYGLCLLTPNAGPGCSAGAATNPDKLVSVTTLPGTVAGNPADTAARDFEADFRSQARERDNLILNFVADWHAPWFDVKYLGGFQSFKYYLNAPWLYSQGISSSVENYVLQGPTTPTATCAAIFANAGCTQNLTVDPARTQFTFVENESFFSHELDFQSRGNSRLQWLAGLYWYHENYDQPVNVLDPSQSQVGDPLNLLANPFTPAAANPSRSVYNEDTRLVENSEAAFFQLDWKMTDTLKLTGGLRYTADQKFGEEYFRLVVFDLESAGLGVNTFGADTPAFDVTACPAPGPESGGLYPGAGPCVANPAGGIMRRLDAHWQALTGTVNLQWTPTEDIMAYARYSRGYKTGGFNSGIVAADPLTAPELVNAYEVGYKQTFARVLQSNIAAFFYQYYNDQQPLGVDNGGVVTTEITNLPVVHSYGIELENTWRATRNLTLGLNYAYLHTTIVDMKGLCIEDTADPLALAPGANTNGCNNAPGSAAVLQNLTGQTVPEAPHHKVAATALYRLPIESGAFNFSAAFIYKSGEYNSPFNRSYNYAPGYTQLNLRVTYNDAKDRFTVILFCDNVANTIGYDAAGGIPVTNAGPGQIIDRLASYTAPRTIGGEIQVRFR